MHPIVPCLSQRLTACSLLTHSTTRTTTTSVFSSAIEHPPPEVKYDPAVGRGGGGGRREHVHPHDAHGAAPVPNQAERRQVRDADAGAGEGHAAGEVDGLEVVQVDGDGAPVDTPDLVGLVSRRLLNVCEKGVMWFIGWFVGRNGEVTRHDVCPLLKPSMN